MNPVAELIHPNPASLAEVLDYIRTLEQQLEQRNQEITRREQEIHALEIKTQKLAFELAHLRRFRFGATSEAFSGEQKSLFEEDLDQDLAAVEAELAAEETAADSVPSRSASRRPHPGRTPLPPHLERIEVLHEPEHCTCAACQAALVKIGEEVTEQLHIEPAVFKVIRHIRPKYTCRVCVRQFRLCRWPRRSSMVACRPRVSWPMWPWPSISIICPCIGWNSGPSVRG